MPKNDEDEARRRRRQREDETEEEEQLERAKTGKTGSILIPGASGNLTERMDALMRQAEPLIEQVNGLYNQYMAGVEQRPPVERRRQLEQLMTALQDAGRVAVASYLFRYRSLLNSYLSHRDRWDKLLRDIESGKLRRNTLGKR